MRIRYCNGEITGPKKSSVTLDIHGCELVDLSGARSLGDPEGTILVAATGTLCYLNEAKREAGLIITPTGELHIEAFGAGALLEIEGSLIGRVIPVNTKTLRFEIIFRQTTGKQEVLKCGTTETHLETSENEGTFKASGLETKDAIGFIGQEVEIMA